MRFITQYAVRSKTDVEEAGKAKLSSQTSQRLSQLGSSGLCTEDDLVNVARSASSLKNTKRAAPLLK